MMFFSLNNHLNEILTDLSSNVPLTLVRSRYTLPCRLLDTKTKHSYRCLKCFLCSRLELSVIGDIDKDANITRRGVQGVTKGDFVSNVSNYTDIQKIKSIRAQLFFSSPPAKQ